jgi:phage tail-like protein
MRSDPFATYKFHVEVDGIEGAAFSECSGLDMSVDVLEQPEGGLNEYIHKFPGRTRWSNVTLKRGISVNDALFNWYMDTLKSFNAGNGVKLKNVTITLYSISSSVNMETVKTKMFHLSNAFPVKWTGPNFKTDEAAFAVETLELAHHGITVSKT